MSQSFDNNCNNSNNSNNNSNNSIANSNESLDINRSHPIFKKLSKINGNINHMNVEELRISLNKLNLEIRSVLMSVNLNLKLTNN
jgi:hypothetical protein